MTDKEDSKPQTNAAAGAPETTPDDARLRGELEKAKKDYLYLMAEFDTYRRNAVKERSELVRYGAERFLREFLNVFDNFERALESEVNVDNLESFRAGVGLISTELRSLLQRHGVEEIKSEGETFDPSKHEALSSEPRDDLPPGSVARVFKKAYKLHDKLIRPAQVTVSSAPPAAN